MRKSVRWNVQICSSERARQCKRKRASSKQTNCAKAEAQLLSQRAVGVYTRGQVRSTAYQGPTGACVSKNTQTCDEAVMRKAAEVRMLSAWHVEQVKVSKHGVDGAEAGVQKQKRTSV